MDFSPRGNESGKTILDDQRLRVEKAISEMINDMYKTHLRRMQVNICIYIILLIYLLIYFALFWIGFVKY